MRITNRKEEAKQKGKQKNNGVVLEQHYPSLLARGTTFHSRFSSLFILTTLSIIPSQVVHTLLVSTVMRLWSRNRLLQIAAATVP